MNQKDEKPSTKPVKKWTPEMKRKAAETRAANAKKKAEAEHKAGGNGAATHTYLRHMAEDVIHGIREGEITAKTVRKRDALALLAYCEIHSR